MRAPIVSLLALACSALVLAQEMSWEEYKVKFNKTYAKPGEEAKRQAIFLKTVAFVEEHNANPNKTSRVGLNHLSDRRLDEYLDPGCFRLSDDHELEASRPRSQFLQDLLQDDSPLPQFVDYSQMRDRVSRVKSQGDCDVCWAFATTGLMEGQQKSWNASIDEVVPLSEQQMVDCNFGCHGWYAYHALDYIKSVGGLMAESDYSYMSFTNQSFACKFESFKVFPSTRYLKHYEILPRGDEEALKRVVANYGPVAVSILAAEVFSGHTSGVIYEPLCLYNDTTNHAVLVVGYGEDPIEGDYWLVKNSWDTDWGIGGYGKIARNQSNHCGIAKRATIAVFDYDSEEN